MKVLLVVSVLVAVAMAAPSNLELLKKLISELESKELESKEVEDKNVLHRNMGATSDSLTVQLGKNLDWDRRGSWTMAVTYRLEGEDQSAAEFMDLGFQTWGAWSKSKCEIPGYPGVFQKQCVTITGLKAETGYTVETAIKFQKGANDIGQDIIYGSAQTFYTLASKKSEDLDVKLLKALKDLLEE